MIDWGFQTTNQPGFGNRSIHYARGKTLGGSSALNFMAYHRGTNGSYQKWADEVDDQSYTFENLLPYFQRSTNVTYPNNETLRSNVTIHHDHSAFRSDLPYHQPLHASWASYINVFSTWAYKALHSLGLESSNGFDSGSLRGPNYVLTSITPDQQHRDSSQTSFLDYSMRTSDIKVYTQSMARRIFFDDDVATGVLITTGGKNYTLAARKEIVLSAGAMQSPQLLMVSGIGPKDILQNYDIPLVKHLPGVGQSMMDHIYFGIGYQVDVPTASKLQYDPEYAATAAESYRTNGTGPLTVAANMAAFERLSESVPELLSNATINDLNTEFPSDWPDTEYLAQDVWSGISNRNAVVPDDNNDYAELIIALVAPFSRGNVTIQSADSTVHPVINPNWLTDSRDKDQAIAAFKRGRQVWEQMHEITVGDEFQPGPETKSDEDIWRWIQQTSITVWHASATCKMGRVDDEMAVVDSKARVYGTQNLRVVDASAFPFLPPGHPQSTIYMLAEKIAEDVKMMG